MTFVGDQQELPSHPVVGHMGPQGGGGKADAPAAVVFHLHLTHTALVVQQILLSSDI